MIVSNPNLHFPAAVLTRRRVGLIVDVCALIGGGNSELTIDSP
jgi:hypothetical protein